eukprot:scaffold31613_cov59-Cyclotella_meneghiniana.AAC.2
MKITVCPVAKAISNLRSRNFRSEITSCPSKVLQLRFGVKSLQDLLKKIVFNTYKAITSSAKKWRSSHHEHKTRIKYNRFLTY